MALNPQFPNYANGAAGTEVIFYTVVGGLPLYRLPPKLVDTGFGAALVGGGSTPYPPDSDEFSPPKIVSPGTLEGIFIEDETITHTAAVVSGNVTSQTVTWWVRKNTGTTKVAENVSTYTLESTDVGGFLYVEVFIEGPNGTDTAVTQSYGPILPNTVPVPVLTATFTPSEEVGTDASLEITACTNGAVTRVQVSADQSGVIQDVPVSTLPVTVTQSGASLVRYIGQYLIFKVIIADGLGNNVIVTYSCGPIVGTAPVIDGTGFISGTATVGQTLTFTPPTVTGTPTPTVVYNWYRQGSGVIVGTGLTYTPTNDDLGKFLYVTTVATNPVGSDTATSLDFGPITGTGPVVVEPGVLSPESVEVGEIITLNPIPSFSGNPTPAVSWMWRDAVDESRVVQVGGTTYRPKQADIGRSLLVASTAVNLSGTVQAVSNSVEVQSGPPITVTPSVLLDLTPEVRQQIGAKKATFDGYPEPVITSFGFWDYTDPMNPVPLVDGENVTTYEVKDGDFGKEIAFVTVAENEYGTTTSVSAISSPVAGFLVVTGSSQLNYEAPVQPGTVLSGGQATFNGVPDPSVSQFGFAYENGDGTYTPILSSVGQTSYTVQNGDTGLAVSFYTTATSLAVPSGVTSYSASTGTIGEEFKFLTKGDIQYSGQNPVVGATLTLQTAITAPRNQTNTPPGPVNLTWIWISSKDPSTPIGTPNSLTYVAQPSDFGYRIGIVWTATYQSQTITAQTIYTGEVIGNPPAVVTPGTVGGDVSTIPSTLTLTPPTFSGSNVTTSWVWVDDLGTEWQTGGLTLTTTQQMSGRKMQVKTTATNFAGSVVDTTNFSDVIGNSNIPVFTYDGTVTGPLDYFRSVYNLDPPRAETAGVPAVVTWEWITSSSFDGSTDVIVIPDEDNRLGISTLGMPANWFQDRFIMVRARARNSYGQVTDTVSSSIGPMGRLPVLTQQATIVGDPRVDNTVSIGNDWGFSNAETVSWNWIYSDDLTVDSGDTIFQVGGTSALIPPEALGKYIAMRAAASNSYGTTVAGSPIYGPVLPNPNPIIEEEGKIVGDLVFGSQQPATFVLPRVRNTSPTTRYTWTWEILLSSGKNPVQLGGTTLSLDWFNTVGGGADVYGTQWIGREVAVTYTITNEGGGTVTGRVVADKLTDCSIGTFGSGEILITGGTKSATGPAVFSGMTLACQIPQIEYMTLGNENTPNPNPVKPPGLSPNVNYDWIYADFATGITSITVTKQGCYPVKPIISLPTACLRDANIQLNWAATKGVYTINGIAPTVPVNNQGTITIQAPAGGVAPTVADVVYVTKEDGSVWISQIIIATPGSGYNDSSPIIVLKDGVQITNQQFTPVYGFLTNGATIVSEGLGYVSNTVPILVTSPYDLFPFVGQGNTVDAAVILGSNTPTITLPRNPALPNNGVIGVSLVATGATDQVAPLVSQSNVLYEYYAPGGNQPIFINRPTIYGVANSSTVLTCNATFAAWSGSSGDGPIRPGLAAPGEVNAGAIYPSIVTYTWKYYEPGTPQVVRQLVTSDNTVPYIDLKKFPTILRANGRIYCDVTARNGATGGITTVKSQEVEFTVGTSSVTNSYSATWCGYLTLTRTTSAPANKWQFTLDAMLGPDGQSPMPDQLSTIYSGPSNTDPLFFTCRLAQVLPDGGIIYQDFPKPTNAAAGRKVSLTLEVNSWRSVANWVEIFPTNGGADLGVCRSNVIGTTPVENYIVAGGMSDLYANPGTQTPNIAALNGSGGFVGTQAPIPTYIVGPNGIQDQFLQVNPPVGNLTRPLFGSGVPYGAIDFRGTVFSAPSSISTNMVLAGPTVGMKFNPNSTIGTPPTVEYYVGYKQWVDNAICYGIGVQWDWRIEDITNPGLIPPINAGRWALKDDYGRPLSGIIAPVAAYGQAQLKWNFGPKAVPWYSNGHGFQYSINFGDNWSALSGNTYLVPQDWLRWSLFQDSQASSVYPVDINNSVKAWWVVASPDGSFIERVAPIAPAPIDGAWESKLYIKPDFLGKMIGIEIQPNSPNARVMPFGLSQYYWASYCSASRQFLSPFPPTV